MARIVLRRLDPDHEAGVGVALVARILAHPVGDDAPDLGGRGHHRSARAHAEAVDGASVRTVVRQGVGRRAEVRVAGAGAEAGLVDPALRMLDPEADGEGLGLYVDAAGVQHLEGVAGAVAHRQHHVVGGERVAGGEAKAPHAPRAVGARLDLEVVDPAAEAVFAAEGLDGSAHRLDHGHEAEGADVGVGLGQDLGRRAGLDELGQDLAAEVTGVLDLAVELAVGEGAGPALAELDVGFGIEDAAPPQAPGVFRAFAHHLAAVEDDGAKTHLGQDQAREQAAGPGSDHHRAGSREVLRRFRYEAVAGVGGGADMGVACEPGEHVGLVAHRHVDRIDHQDRRLLARIVGAAGDRDLDQILGRDLKAGADGVGQRLGRMAERQLEVGQAQHAPGFTGASRRPSMRRLRT